MRQYNKAFAFTSTGGSGRVDGSVLDGQGPPCYKIQGKLYHWLGPVQPPKNGQPIYSQLYIYDNSEALQHRQHNNPGTDQQIISLLQDILLRVNLFVPLYEQARFLTESTSLPSYHLRLDFLHASDERWYNLPRASYELVAIIPSDVNTCITSREVIVRPKGGPLLRITECHPSYVALHFPLLSLTAQRGWDTDMHLTPTRNTRIHQPRPLVRDQLSLCAFLQFRLHPWPLYIESDHYFRAGLLFQEYIVEMWLAAEHQRLRWICEHQADLHADLYTGVLDALHKGLQPSAVGRKVILPSSFVSGLRCMNHNMQNTLALLVTIRTYMTHFYLFLHVLILESWRLTPLSFYRPLAPLFS